MIRWSFKLNTFGLLKTHHIDLVFHTWLCLGKILIGELSLVPSDPRPVAPSGAPYTQKMLNNVQFNRSSHRKSKARRVSASIPAHASGHQMWLWVDSMPAMRRTMLAVRLPHDRINQQSQHTMTQVPTCWLRQAVDSAMATNLTLVPCIMLNLKGVCWGKQGLEGKKAAPTSAAYAHCTRHRAPGWKTEQGLQAGLCATCQARCPGPGHTYPRRETLFLICTMNQVFINPNSEFKFKTMNIISSQIHAHTQRTQLSKPLLSKPMEKQKCRKREY